MKRLIVPFLLLLLLGASGKANAQGPTNTPTLTPTQTPANNATNSWYATPAPPSVCGKQFNPCGPLPWMLINIASPTHVPTVATPTLIPVTATPTYTLTPTSTYTPSATVQTWTPTPTQSVEPNQEGLATLSKQVIDMQNTLNAQQTISFDINGTPVGMVAVAQQAGGYIGWPIGVLRSITSANLGILGTVINFVIMLILAFAFIEVSLAGIPIVKFVINLLLSIIQAFKPF